MTPDGASPGWVWTRRAVLGAAGAALLGAAFVPRRPRAAAEVPAGRVAVDYWEKWTGPEGAALQRVVDRFNTVEQGRFWVRRVPVSDIASKAIVAIAGGDPPDVVGVFSYNLPQFAESGAVVALDASDLPGGPLSAGVYTPSVARLMSHRGRLWAGAASVYNLALYRNRAHFREAGLDPDAPPTTVEALDGCAQRLERVRPTGEIERAGFLPTLPGWWPYFWPVMFGGKLYDPVADRAVLTDADTVAAYRWVQGASRRLGVGPTRAFTGGVERAFHSPMDPFIGGRVSMIVQGPWLANFINLHNPGLDYAASPVPLAGSAAGVGHPAGLMEADVLVIPRGCKNPEGAAEFVRFTQRQDVQEELAAAHGKASPLARVSEGFYAGHVNRSIRVHDEIARSPAALVLPQTRVWPAYADLVVGMFDRVWSGAGVEGELAGVERRAQELLDHAAAMRRARQGAGGEGGGA
jgi:ABC-type glycerol-3-phosphate transport system substrate-binding protein